MKPAGSSPPTSTRPAGKRIPHLSLIRADRWVCLHTLNVPARERAGTCGSSSKRPYLIACQRVTKTPLPRLRFPPPPPAFASQQRGEAKAGSTRQAGGEATARQAGEEAGWICSMFTFGAPPTPDSFVRRPDAHRCMLNDGTVLGWDRLSAWPFNGPWNSRIGKNARQGVEIMEGRRGRLVAHLCSGTLPTWRLNTAGRSSGERQTVCFHKARWPRPRTD